MASMHVDNNQRHLVPLRAVVSAEYIQGGLVDHTHVAEADSRTNPFDIVPELPAGRGQLLLLLLHVRCRTNPVGRSSHTRAGAGAPSTGGTKRTAITHTGGAETAASVHGFHGARSGARRQGQRVVAVTSSHLYGRPHTAELQLQLVEVTHCTVYDKENIEER